MSTHASPFDRSARALVAAATRIAEAEAQSRLLARVNDPARWRRAQLVWPLFTQG